MENKEKSLIILEKQKNVFVKFKNFFKKLFYKGNYNTSNVKQEEINNVNNENKFKEQIKTEVNISEITNEIKKEEFLKEIEKDEIVLYNLSLDRLKVLEKYYEDRVKKKRMVLENLKKNN